MDVTAAPDAIRELVGWLESHAFVPLETSASGPQNQNVMYGRGPLRIEVNATRGDWSIGMGVAQMSDLYHPDEWEAWLARAPLSDEHSPLDHQVEFIEREVLGLPSRLGRTRWGIKKVERELERMDREYVDRVLGPPVDG